MKIFIITMCLLSFIISPIYAQRRPYKNRHIRILDSNKPYRTPNKVVVKPKRPGPDYEWVKGHTNARGKWIKGHWKKR